jgi:hypothetical protein
MNIGRAQKRITFYVILPAALVYFGLRFYAQFRHVDVFVGRVAPMPAELAAGLHMEEHKIDPIVRIESPYDSAADKILSPEEIHRLRTSIAWSSAMPAFIDSLTILSASNVVARQNGKSYMREYQLAKEGDHWVIVSMKRSQVHRYSPD